MGSALSHVFAPFRPLLCIEHLGCELMNVKSGLTFYKSLQPWPKYRAAELLSVGDRKRCNQVRNRPTDGLEIEVRRQSVLIEARSEFVEPEKGAGKSRVENLTQKPVGRLSTGANRHLERRFQIGAKPHVDLRE